MTDPNTRTNEEEIVTTSVETVETVEYQCAVCEQWYDDEDDMVAVTLNATPDNSGVYGVEQVCQPCAKGLFDYEGPTYGTVAPLRDEARRWTFDDVAELGKRALVWPLKKLSTLIPLLITGGIVWGVLNLMPEPSAETTSEFEQASEEIATASTDMFGLIGVVMLVMIFAVVFNALRTMPRMRR